MAVKASTTLNIVSHYEDIINYIDEKIADLQTLINDAINAASYTQDKYDAIVSLVGQINDKIPEDAVDRLVNIGTIDDFQQGLSDALNS